MKYKLLRYTLLSLLVMLCSSLFASEQVYTFTSKSWAATCNEDAANWTSGKDGNQLSSGRGIQVTTGVSGANATSPSSFTNVSKIVVTYSTNASAGAGNISLKIGENDAVAKDVTKTGGTTDRELVYEYATTQSGAVTITVNCTTNSIYVKSIAITEDDANDTRAATAIEFSNTVIAGGVGRYIDFPTATVKAGETTIENAAVEWSISDATIAENVRGRLHLLKTGTAIIKADYAGNETEYKPSSKSYTLTVTENEYDAISALQENATTTAKLTTFHFNGQQVVYVDGDYAYLSDGGHGAFISTAGHGLEAGQVLIGTTTFKFGQHYSGKYLQLTGFSKEGLQITTADVVPVEMSIAEIATSCQSTLRKLKNVVYKADTRAFYSGNDSILYYNKFNVSNVKLEDGKKYNVTGIIVLYYQNEKLLIEIAPRSLDDIEVVPDTYQAYFKAMPHAAGTVTATPSSETYVAGTQVSLSQEANEGWEFVNWTGGPDGSTIISTDATCTVTISSDTVICANFQEKQVVPAGFKDIVADFTNQSFFTEADKEGAKAGLKMGNDGSFTRVSAEDASANAVISGKYHSNEHGISNFSATVKVDGPVKITFGTCEWGGNVTVKDAEGKEVVNAFSTNTGACYHNNKETNIVSAIYKGEATTLTIAGGAYVPYFAVESVNPEELAPTYTLTFSAGEGEGVLPASLTLDEGDEVEIEPNTSLFKEGYTLTGWSDGTNTYKVGDKFTMTGDVTLTAQFTANTVSLADRKSAVHLEWALGEQFGTTVNLQGKSGFIVTQAEVDGQKIDVKLDIDATNGKFFNEGRGDEWAQVNAGTKLTIPSCKGAHVSLDAYGEIKTTTIDGQTDYTPGTHVDYTVASAAESIDIIVQDGSYYSMLKVDLPVVQSQGGGQSYENATAKVNWPFSDSNAITAYTAQPDGAFSTVAADAGDLTITGVGTRTADDLANGISFIKLKPAGSSQAMKWVVKPAAGLTFTPTRVSMWIQRFATDAENGVTITATVGNGEPVTLGNFTAPRANKNQADDKFGKNTNWKNLVEIELTNDQKTALTSSEELTLSATIGVGSTKEGGFSDVIIEGFVNGTAAQVEKFSLAARSNMEEAGSVSVYPAAETYEAGTEVTLTATENFGYDFVNWTDAEGGIISEDAKFKYTLNSDAVLTANFKKVETYELDLTIDGTNEYMVTVDPMPTIVDEKPMYEAGTVVQLNANQYEGLVTFTNWSDGETNSSKTVKMDADVTLDAFYAETDIIAGWDFYVKGNSGRVADFASSENVAAALSLTNAEGETKSWLDKSTEAAGGYESFKGAAVNWNVGSSNGDVGNYYWQTKVNAADFTDIKVQFQMLYNYNAYQKYNVEYSLNGETWVNAGSITMTGAKNPASFEGTLPAEANNQAELFIRLIADKTSSVDGTASTNDGNALSMFFITGTPKLVDDGTAPVLVSSVPADGTTGASATGKIVLNFDEKIKVAEGVTAELTVKPQSSNPDDYIALTPTVSGKAITFEYKGLEYATTYYFVLSGNSVSDLTDNAIADAVSFSFTTMERPAVQKGSFDAVVENVEQLKAALKAAETRADQNTRFRIFLKNGTYQFPQSDVDKTYTVDLADGNKATYTKKDPITYLKASNVSFIGESRDGVVITNTTPAEDTFVGKYGTASIYEGIGNSDVIQIASSVSGLYWQDLTVKTGLGDARGRDIAIQDKGRMNIYKNTCLWGYQDTWTSNNDNGLYYFEGGKVRGRTDFLCGKGDMFLNGVDIQVCMNTGGYIAVPSKSIKYGFVFKDCTIKGESNELNGKFTLGRPWGSGTPIALWINTKMEIVPSAAGWNEMSGGWPKRFAEFNSMTANGTPVDLSGRKKEFGNEGDKHANNPVLTAAEALEAGDLHNMFGEWDPTLATEQAPAPKNVKLEGTTLSWDNSQYAFCWAVVKNNTIVAFTDEPTFTIDEASATWSVRAANEMGGLGEAVDAVVGAATAITNVNKTAVDNTIFDLQGRKVNLMKKGLYIIDGKKVVK